MYLSHSLSFSCSFQPDKMLLSFILGIAFNSILKFFELREIELFQCVLFLFLCICILLIA